MSDCKQNEIIVPPFECLEKYCTAKGEQCFGCAYSDYPWFVFTSAVAKNGELCYNVEDTPKKIIP